MMPPAIRRSPDATGESGGVRVLLIGNYVADHQPSMQRFAELLQQGLSSRGVAVTLLRPPAVLGRHDSAGHGLDKWAGYADKFALFIPELRRRVRRPGSLPLVVHVCDHSNSPYVPWLGRVPHVVTCHDLLAVRSARGEFAETGTRWSGRYLQAAIVRGLRQARHIACDSEATRADVRRIVGTADDRLEIVHPAIAPAFGPLPADEALARVNGLLGEAANGGAVAAGGYLLHVGGNQWYKNRAGLLAIYAALVERLPGAPPLVVAGRPLPAGLRRSLEARGLTRRVIELSNVTDADLAALYACAALLVFPSLAEGYGWPVLEAMACGCRVVTSGRPPLTEVGGDVADYVDPDDPSGAAAVIAGVLGESVDERRIRRAAALVHAARFSSDSMTDAYIRTYATVVEAAHRNDATRVVRHVPRRILPARQMRHEAMRILHVIRSADPAGGGPIEAVTRLGIEHDARGRHVEIATLDSPDAPWLKTLPLPVHALGPVSTKYGYTPRLVPWLRQKAGDFDIVVVNGLWQYTSFAVWRAVKPMGVPYVVFPHGMLDPWFRRRYPLKHLKKWLYWPWAEYRVLRDAAAVLFTSDEEQRMARESFWLYRCNERVITYGTASPPDETATERQQLMERFPRLDGRRLILFFGRIHEKKGCELLIRAFASQRAPQAPGDRPWQLVFAGPIATKAYERELMTLCRDAGVADQVTWTGMLTGDLKWAAFRNADVFVLPSHQENFGIAVAEALACGTPVLISDKVNIWREILADGAGLVAPDTQAGTDRLLSGWMALSEAVRDRMRARARACFAERFDVRLAAERMADVLGDLA